MKKLTIIIVLLISFVAKSQSIKEQILENISEIKSVDIYSDDFSDLEVIGDAIGNAKIVFLGEQDHGDATTFEAKARLVKYLHEEKGFNVLAFESDFFNINKKADEKQPVAEIIKDIYPIWTYCKQVTPFFNDYLKTQKESLIISGFDCQIGETSNQAKTDYLIVMKNYISKNMDVSKIKNYPFFEKISIKILNREKVKKSDKKIYFELLSEIINNIKNRKNFLFKSLENIYAYAKSDWYFFKEANRRDAQMGENIIWLHKIKFPEEKIIIWAHSAHLTRKIENKNGKRKNTYPEISAGEYVSNRLDSDLIYSIGFSSRTGRTNRINSLKGYNISKPKKESFETWVHSKKYNFAFVNFRGLKNTSEVFNMKGESHSNIEAKWLGCFDGMFYIDKMYPCVRK
ncbi:erythromycin esterase family protein [Tenacibaculum finnmarkense]|uniref:erythromycin esterase family protein n=1 Tax=Tenacibaculum finnmarkense TaxID=2781243 RepID=UPI001E3EDC1E|nr:erythromycin esterase family protein [Tenacibaculum finnmarkense]MCD8411503.1 erythromycin esterase family protein [Tenacibaculum finnmarkense genomovar ulcerans]MCG8208275.1 erythromycin esterase family protein [Tenacibaculum finnmarkense genomovar finnmarkense]MCG8724240.1 erythromycin esterase family protein [Tenacibaculum finnmarkense]MCG8742578.1 erythromycin esterase family protein [Tenacibaculum finnmarkense]MCG8765964.1 erythromycin esterase family protein [Tenacibaculum finnmarkens